jgi:hypothetical protein
MRVLVLTSTLMIAAAAASADVKVSLHEGRMDILATRVSIADILDRVARQTGMKIIYDGPRPQKMLTKSVTNRTPADAVLGMLEGEGLNFAVILNAAGTQIETLLVTGPSKAKPAPRTLAAPGAPGQNDGWSVEIDEPPPPPPPVPPVDGAANGEPAPPPPNGAGQPTNNTPPPMTLPSPTPMPASPFTPQGPGPILLPTLGPSPTPAR